MYWAFEIYVGDDRKLFDLISLIREGFEIANPFQPVKS